MKVFVLSLHRCGTKNLSRLLYDLGLPTIHFPERRKGAPVQPKIVGRETELDFVLDTITPAFQGYVGASDVPIPVLYKQLLGRFHDARFVLLTRDAGDWIRSVRRRKSGRDFHPFERVQYWHYFPSKPPGLDHLTDDDLSRMCHQHTTQVTDFFSRTQPAKLGVFELYDPDVGSAVASFLGFRGKWELPHRAKRKRFQAWRSAPRRVVNWLLA